MSFADAGAEKLKVNMYVFCAFSTCFREHLPKKQARKLQDAQA